MSKYLGERLTLDDNPRTMIVRTSWLYGGFAEDRREKTEDRKVFKNFVNTMLRLSEARSELKVVNDQHGIPTSCIDLSCALAQLVDSIDQFIENGDNILHFSNSCSEGSITWADFAREIFSITGRDTQVIDCSSSEYPTKAQRPEYSILKNTSGILLPDWKAGLSTYIYQGLNE